MKDIIEKNKIIIILVIGAVILFGLVAYTSLNHDSNSSTETETLEGSPKVLGALNIADITSNVLVSEHSYSYYVEGIIENLSVDSSIWSSDDSYVIEAKYYDSNGNLLELETGWIEKES